MCKAACTGASFTPHALAAARLLGLRPVPKPAGGTEPGEGARGGRARGAAWRHCAKGRAADAGSGPHGSSPSTAAWRRRASHGAAPGELASQRASRERARGRACRSEGASCCADAQSNRVFGGAVHAREPASRTVARPGAPFSNRQQHPEQRAGGHASPTDRRRQQPAPAVGRAASAPIEAGCRGARAGHAQGGEWGPSPPGCSVYM